MHRLLLLATVLALVSLKAVPAQECGDAAGPCAVALGDYQVLLPNAEPPAGGFPLVVHFHGYGQTGRNVIDNARLTAPLLARGHALLAPNGLAGEDGRPTGWTYGNLRQGSRDEAAFLRQVLADAARGLPIDLGRVLLTGYSIGGSLVWYLACADPAIATAYAPLAGGFWRPHPETCRGPAPILHSHGWTDLTVPLEGRHLRPELSQGDIPAGLALWRRTNGCEKLQPDSFTSDDTFWQRHWTSCDAPLTLALHQGGHLMPDAWPDLALDWLEAVVAAGQVIR